MRTDSKSDETDQFKSELKEVARKLVVLCTPWPDWKVSGPFIAELPEVGTDSDKELPGVIITKNDTVGDRILSFVPGHLHEAFLSPFGQKIVSSL